MRRRRSFPAVLVLASIAAATAAPVGAQAGAIEGELAGIRASLERIVELLERQAIRSQGDLILRRLEIKSARLVPIEERLRSTRSALTNVETERLRVKTMLEQWEDESFAAETEQERRGYRESVRQGLQSLEHVERQATSLLGEIDQLERERDQLSAEIDQLERELDSIEAQTRRP